MVARRSKLAQVIPSHELTQHPRTARDLIFGKRHRLGGTPDFLESAEIPKCRFGKEMTFYAQLDSVNDEFMLADRGMIYVFVCFDCFEMQAFLQSE